jgi:uncharacterized protein
MPNHLAGQTSPYLLQHVDNPVDWRPWGEEALHRARSEDKPILLSIGYSACHWCHVMAHESFEDPETAAVMNELCVNVKVDREERPDLDQIYQLAHHLLTRRSGGWPLTVFLNPHDLTPFFSGTYFPKQPRYNLPGFSQLVAHLAQAFHAQRGDIERQNASLLKALGQAQPDGPVQVGTLDPAPLQQAVTELAQIFDPAHGGFGAAPKFPHAAEIEFCFRIYAANGDAGARNMALSSLEKMASGGIYDQIGGGFCRYSVDQFWTIPHFEKMLYDNGPLLRLYADAWRLTNDPRCAQVVHESAAWVLREMQSPEGGYYSTIDADSEHEEGKFYVWTPDRVRALLSAEENAVTASHYGLDRAANFEAAHWHLRIAKPLPEVATALGIALDVALARLASAKAKLFASRQTRVRPGLDNKVLVSWNGLMVKGMAHAGAILGQSEWIASAQRSVDFIRERMWKDGRLLATCKDGKAHLNAYLDDYAFLLDALLELLQADFRLRDLNFAQQLAEVLLAQFEDSESGGFFFTSHDHETLIHRPKAGPDNATPSGNGIAAFALQRLGHLLGEARYLASAERTLRLFYPALVRQPNAFPTLLNALEEYHAPPQIVILRGPQDALRAWMRELFALHAPSALWLAIATDVKGLPSALDKPATHTVNAWVCRGVSCLAPIDDLQALLKVCKSSSVPA